MKNANKLNNKGFTLMELIIVVAIMAILIALIAPNLVGFLDKATTTSYDANAKSCYTAASAWATQERIDGKIVDGTVKADKNGITSGISDSTQKAALQEVLGTANFGSGTLEITFDKGKCKSVSWDPDGTGSVTAVTYPK